MIKTCRCCNCNLPIIDFYKNSSSKDGYHSNCKVCLKNKKQQFYISNKNNILQQKKQYYSNNPVLKKNYEKRYYQCNKEYRRQYLNKWHKLNPNYHKKTIQRQLAANLRSRIYNALHKQHKHGSVIDNLGCTINSFKIYLQLKFYRRFKNNDIMSWNNYGSEWHIDHIKPLSAFDLTNPDKFKKACHYSNLQPLWKEENLRKSSKWGHND